MNNIKKLDSAIIVDRIAELMARGQWVRGPSRAKLAEEYGCSPQYISRLAAEAARRVHSGSASDLSEIRAASVARLEMIAAQAHQGRNFAAAIRAIDSLSEVSGLSAANKRDATSIVDSDEWQGLLAAISDAANRFTSAEDTDILMNAISNFVNGGKRVDD